MKLDSNLIYDAALDDELFARLPNILAEATGSRSCVLHWRDQQGSAEVFAHSGYFSDDHMADYAANFVAHDLWTEAGMRQGFINQAWRVTDLVATDDFERSVFFNEWIRAMGDDTYYCSGSVMRTRHGDGIVGLHRGRGQDDFSRETLGKLNGYVGHLRRMFEIRARVAGLGERNRLLDSMLACNGQAAFVLDRHGRVVLASRPGETILTDGSLLRLSRGMVKAARGDDDAALQRAVAAAASPSNPAASTVVLHDRSDRAIVATAMPIGTAVHSSAAVLLSLQSPPPPLPGDLARQQLQERYGLSAAEADIAIRLADGGSPRSISDQRQSSIATVRSQIKHVLAKMGVQRQTDVVRLVLQAPR